MANQVALTGNVVEEPTFQQLPQNSLLKFTVADKYGWGDKEKTSFFDVVVFGNKTKVGQYLHKGSKVTVYGRLQQDKWQNKDGQMQSKVGIVANQVELCGGGKPRNNQGGQQYQQPAGQPMPEPSPQYSQQTPPPQFQQPEGQTNWPNSQEPDVGSIWS